MELEKRSGVTQKAISKIERGDVEEPRSLYALARALELTYDELMAGVETARRPHTAKSRVEPFKNRPHKTRSRWPFGIPFARFDKLSIDDKNRVELAVLEKIQEAERRGEAGKKRSSPR